MAPGDTSVECAVLDEKYDNLQLILTRIEENQEKFRDTFGEKLHTLDNKVTTIAANTDTLAKCVEKHEGKIEKLEGVTGRHSTYFKVTAGLFTACLAILGVFKEVLLGPEGDVMIPDTTEKNIFVSIPKTFTFGGSDRTAGVESGENPNIDALLSDNDVAVILSFFGETEDRELTPPHHKLQKSEGPLDTVKYLKGAYETCTVSMDVYVKSGGNVHDNPAMLKAYLRLLTTEWFYRDLRQVVEVLDKSSVPDLSVLEEGTNRKHLDVTVRYRVGYIESVESIVTIDPCSVELEE